MSPIVCATRGGEASRRTQERAIALAKETGAELIFLYVVDTTFAEAANKEMHKALINELRLLGRSLLRLAEMRAREHDLQAQLAMREGPVLETIEDFVRESDASTLVIGSPHLDEEGANTFEPNQVSGFAAALEADTGAEVIVVR